MKAVLKLGSYATGAYEPCQVLTEAALSKMFCVPWGCLGGAGSMGTVWVSFSIRGAWLHIINRTMSTVFLFFGGWLSPWKAVEFCKSAFIPFGFFGTLCTRLAAKSKISARASRLCTECIDWKDKIEWNLVWMINLNLNAIRIAWVYFKCFTWSVIIVIDFVLYKFSWDHFICINCSSEVRPIRLQSLWLFRSGWLQLERSYA